MRRLYYLAQKAACFNADYCFQEGIFLVFLMLCGLVFHYMNQGKVRIHSFHRHKANTRILKQTGL